MFNDLSFFPICENKVRNIIDIIQKIKSDAKKQNILDDKLFEFYDIETNKIFGEKKIRRKKEFDKTVMNSFDDL